MKRCLDCKWFFEDDGLARCNKEELCEPDYVYGGYYPGWCKDLRKFDSLCAPEGRFWEEKKSGDKKES